LTIPQYDLINFSGTRENKTNGFCGLLEWAAEPSQQMGAGRKTSAGRLAQTAFAGRQEGIGDCGVIAGD
jgi:hypothetical protein